MNFRKFFLLARCVDDTCIPNSKGAGLRPTVPVLLMLRSVSSSCYVAPTKQRKGQPSALWTGSGLGAEGLG